MIIIQNYHINRHKAVVGECLYGTQQSLKFVKKLSEG